MLYKTIKKIVNDNNFFTGLKPSKSYKTPKRLRKSQTRRSLIRLVLELLSLAMKVIWWLPKVFQPCEVAQEDFDLLLNCMHRVVKTRGVKGFLTYVKAIRGAFLAAIAGEPKKRHEFCIRTYPDGIPKCFGTTLTRKVRIALVPGNNDVAILRLVNTLLFCTRALCIGQEAKTQTITDPPYEGPLRITCFTRDFWKHIGYPRCSKSKVPGSVRFKKYHFTTKSGPEGHALWSSMLDYINLDEDLKRDIQILGGNLMKSNFKKLDFLLPFIKKIPNLPVSGGTKLRKIISFPEKEDKVRVVAILDYFSQTVLRPLHLFLFRVLRKIPQDCTFEQESFIEKIKDWDYFCSADLTAATDRFPLRLINEVLMGYFPKWYVEALTRILVDRPFFFKDKELKYATGNPMGAYASWSSFTISHHYVVYYCCRRLNIPYRTAKYCMLGDDIVIGDRALADLYMEVMLDLGVTINLTKSHKSKYFCEFAKRLIYRGTEITPFPISSLKETSKRYFTLTNLFMEWESKGYHCINGVSATVYSYYEFIRPISSQKRAEWRDKSRFCEVITKVMTDIIPADDALNGLAREFNYQFRELSLSECESILSNIAVEMFADSNPVNNCYTKEGSLKKDQPLWLINYLLNSKVKIKEWIGYDFSPIPIFSCYERIEKKFEDMINKAFEIDTEGRGEWPKSLLTMELPTSDSIFFTKEMKKPIKVIDSKIGEHLRYRFDILQSPLGSSLLA